MYGHYSASILPIIYLSAAAGLARTVELASKILVRSPRISLRQAGWLGLLALSVFAVAMNATFSLWPATERLRWDSFVMPMNDVALGAALEKIPDGTSVSTTDQLSTHLAGRRFLYLF